MCSSSSSSSRGKQQCNANYMCAPVVLDGGQHLHVRLGLVLLAGLAQRAVVAVGQVLAKHEHLRQGGGGQ